MQSNRGPNLSGNRLLAAAALVLAIVVALVYGNAVHDARVHDDNKYVSYDRPLDAATAVALFREHTAATTNFGLPFYRPIASISIALDARLYGQSTAGYHATNVVLHALCAVLLFLWLWQLLSRRGDDAQHSALLSSFLGALIFAVHPVHTEAVNSIYNRSQILATLFCLAGLVSAYHFVPRRPRLGFALAAGFYFLALGSKESAVVFPLLLGAALYLLPPTEKRPALWQLLILLLPLGVFLQLRQQALSHLGSVMTRGQSSLPWMHSKSGVLLAMLATVRDALALIIYPHPLRASYADFAPHGLVQAAIVLLILVAVALRYWRSRPELLLGAVLFVVPLVLPLFRQLQGQMTANAFAERQLYLPFLGVSLALAFTLWRLANNPPKQLATATARRLIAASAIVICVIFSGLTHRRNIDWHDHEALWLAEVQAAPQNGDGAMQLSTFYLRQGRISEVMTLCTRAQNRDWSGLSMHAQLDNNCAVAAQRSGDFVEAERRFQMAIAHGAGPSTQANLARMYLRQGRRREAEAAYLAAVAAETDEAMRHVRRAELLLRIYPQRRDDARDELLAALRIDPKLALARQWLTELHAAPAPGL